MDDHVACAAWSAATLRVDILTEGVHSGDASGIVPSSFRILRQLLSRVEDEHTGRIRVEALHVQIPQARRDQAEAVAEALGEEVYSKFPWVEGAHPVTSDGSELILNRTWRPALSVTGVEGMPALASAGNVLRPYTAVKLSMRIPPRLDPKAAAQALKEALESDPPYGAKVTFEGDKASAGWDAPPLAPWLEAATQEASRTYFGKPSMAMGEGGTIPFMEMLGQALPRGAVPHHRRAGPRQQRARAQRVPAHPHGQEAHLLRGQRHLRALRALRENGPGGPPHVARWEVRRACVSDKPSSVARMVGVLVWDSWLLIVLVLHSICATRFVLGMDTQREQKKP